MDVVASRSHSYELTVQMIERRTNRNAEHRPAARRTPDLLLNQQNRREPQSVCLFPVVKSPDLRLCLAFTGHLRFDCERFLLPAENLSST